MRVDFLGKDQREFLEVGNYHVGQTLEERFDEIEYCIMSYAPSYGEDMCKFIVELIEQNILSLSTPEIANLGKKKVGNTVPLVASCHNVTVGNSIYDIYNANLEVAMLSKLGGGVGIDFDLLPQKGTEISQGFFSNSRIDWIESLVDTSQKVSQSGVRRGFATPYLDIESVEFYDLLKKIDKKNVEKGVLVDNTIGIKIRDSFIDKLEAKDKEARKRWLALMTARQDNGSVYISYIGNMNKNQQVVFKKLGLEIETSNICTEFTQPNIEGHTPTCILLAYNLNYWDTIFNNPNIIKAGVYLADIVCEEYIKGSEGVRGLEKARKSVIETRNIGLGALGFHELLQSKGYSFGGIDSRMLNKEIFSTISKYVYTATRELAHKLGPCKFAKDAGFVQRNASLMMVAPNKSTSFICNATSLGIEPVFSNIFTKKLAKKTTTVKNRNLQKLLDSKGKNTKEVWKSISENLGSVQHLDFLSEEEKEVFLTFSEISPKDIIDLAADRQVYIDMSQSLNLMNRPNYSLKDMHEMHMYAYKKGIKTLYYFYPQAHATIEQEGKKWDACISCAD